MGTQACEGRQRGSYGERDVVPVLTAARVPPARSKRPQQKGERLQPTPQGQAVGLTTYLSKAPWGMTGRPASPLGSGLPVRSGVHLGKNLFDVRLRHRSRFGSCRLWRGNIGGCASRF
eukprot:2968679-Amphidinium_carterae.2